ncbi:MAG: DNA-directed RNA polymerase subunit alpha [Candidatus Eisenbacteria bacterium]|nr:DNA-directed RNA polymerase subunit alpha [Candidatus Eisenbacteria bacterium]
MKLKGFQMPKRIEIDEKTMTDRYGRFVVEPLERGFGTTLGNSLRRVLLSSLQGAAVVTVKIDGALHEFATIPGVVEDVAEIILNIKKMRLKMHTDGVKKAYFNAKGKKRLVAGDLEADPDIEVLTPDLHIATINKNGEFKAELEISTGRGYVPVEMQEEPEKSEKSEKSRNIGTIPIDALFSPIERVSYFVESARVGQRIDYDRLIVEIWTDGSVLPGDALAHAARILRDHFSLFIHFEEEVEEEAEVEEDEETRMMRKLLERSVEELELSVRAANCLRNAGIVTIADLVRKTEQDMLKYRNFGKKSLKEISEILARDNLHFGMDVSKYRVSSKPEDTTPKEEKVLESEEASQ